MAGNNTELVQIKFDEKGLVPAVVQDHDDGAVLMVAFMNETALKRTVETGFAHYWSRSRKELWKKGDTSGHTQEVKQIRVDCDADCILLIVKQNGPGACHTGFRTCFYRDIEGREVETKAFDDKEVYGK